MYCRCSFKAFGVTLLHFKVDKINWGVIFTKKKKKKMFLKWGTPTLENPENRWKNLDFQVFPENSHPGENGFSVFSPMKFF
jgi:hypothetical protein